MLGNTFNHFYIYSSLPKTLAPLCYQCFNDIPFHFPFSLKYNGIADKVLIKYTYNFPSSAFAFILMDYCFVLLQF